MFPEGASGLRTRASARSMRNGDKELDQWCTDRGDENPGAGMDHDDVIILYSISGILVVVDWEVSVGFFIVCISPGLLMPLASDVQGASKRF